MSVSSRQTAVRTISGGCAALALALVVTGCARAARSWPDGAPRFEGRLTLVGRERQGMWRFHYPDGALREEGRYEDGRRVGTWRSWHRNGQLACAGERRWNDATGASEREGTWELWYGDGSLRARGPFRAGLRSGAWEARDEDGALVENESGHYVDGVRVE